MSISSPSLDSLYCQEDKLEDDLFQFQETHSISPISDQDLSWEDDEISALLLKEQGRRTQFGNPLFDTDLVAARDDAVDWVLRVSAHFGFSGLTVVLAVDYFDRFLMSSCFEKDKPWMSQLAAVACISVAVKVEETELHLLLDLQVEESKYVFEPKTVMRMELLILSTLGWKMNPVTPLSFLDHFIRRFGLKKHLHWEFIRTCERIVVSLITDLSFLCYLPSVIAASTIILVIKEVEPSKAFEYQDQLMQILKIPKEKLDACYKLILEKLETSNFLQWTHKRKFERMPKSPNGVIDSYFSCDSSNDSWPLSVKSSPEPPFKKSKARDQQMRLTPINRVSFDALTSHH